MGVLRQAAKRILSSALPRRLFLVRGSNDTALGVMDGATTPKKVALTFDDGPHPVHTPRLLDQLKEHDARATFFVVGEHAAQHRGIVRRIVAEGHDIGNHTYTHTAPDRTSAEKLTEEVRRSRALLEEITGRECTLFRPPMGELTLRKILNLWREGQTVVLWNVDTRDWSATSYDQILAWCRRYEPESGDIVLMHDNRPHAAAAAASLAQRAATLNVDLVRVSSYLSRTRG